MALITIPSLPQKATFQNYSINVADLIALVTQTYFQDQLNWKKVILTYVSSVSNQISLISFTPDELLTVLTAPGYFAAEARSTFQVSNITIYDKQNGRFRLERSQIPDVQIYDLVFAPPSTGTSFFGTNLVNGDRSTHISFDPFDANKMLIGVQSINQFGVSLSYIMPLDISSNGDFDSTLAAKITDTKIQASYYNSDLTKAWVVGQLGTQCCGKSLPAIPVGAGFSVNPPRVVEIDLATGDVTLKADIKDSESGESFNAYTYSLIVDEVSNTVVVWGLGALVGYNMNTNSKLWYKSAQPLQDGYTTGAKARKLEKNGNYFITDAMIYAGTTFPGGGGVVKASFATGVIDPTFPVIPAGTGTASTIFSCSADGTKQVLLNYYNQNGFIINNGVVSSEIIFYNPTSGSPVSAFCANDFLYMLKPSGKLEKYDYSGNLLSTVTLDFSGTTAPSGYSPVFGLYEGNVYSQDANATNIYKFNATTGVRSPAFSGISSLSGSMGEFKFFNSNRLIVLQSSDSNYYSYQTISSNVTSTTTSLATIDYTTKELLHYQGAISGYYAVYMNGIYPMQSSSIADRIFTIGSSEIQVYDTSVTPWISAKSGWPTRPGIGAGWGGGEIIGNYLYIAAGGAGGLTVDDNAGRSTYSYMFRIDLSTKLVDRTFNPTLPGYTLGAAVISQTDNYIYVCNCDTFAAIPLLYRIKKSDNSVEAITYTSLGLTQNFAAGCKINVVQVGANRILVYPDKASFNYDVASNGRLDSSPYIIVSEDTLALNGTQTSVTTDYPFRLMYNPNSNSLGGVSKSQTDGQYHFVSYDLATGDRFQGSSGLTTGNNLYYVNNETTLSMAVKDQYFLFYVTSIMNYNRVPYAGIIRMNPIGTMSN